MRRIRSKGMKPELMVRHLVHAMGYRYRLHCPGLPGKPGSHIPKSRVDYWHPKLRNNVLRDDENVLNLQALGWRVLVVWECETLEGDTSRLRVRLRRFLGRYRLV